MDAARVAAAERRGRGRPTGPPPSRRSRATTSARRRAWPVVANATAANHAAYAAAHGLPYARAAPAGARARCGKLRAVGAALADAPAGKWLVFADADLSFACATATPPGAGLDRALRLAARAGATERASWTSSSRTASASSRRGGRGGRAGSSRGSRPSSTRGPRSAR
ncbi:hypothetical protein JL720_15980 [Aureococcus anophagefferens]|nr:hypothetical protein JL720_15980 [Aureococcus anophagefferens]